MPLEEYALGQERSQDDGAYEVWLLPRQVRDAAGRYAPAQLLGSFAVRIGDLADSSPPAASLLDLPPPAGSAARLLFQLMPSDDVAVDRASIGHENLRVQGPDGSDLPVRLFGVMPAGGGNFRATYALDAPGGRWDAAPRGRYEIRLMPEQLADTSGNFAPPATLGSFQVSPGESADTQPPDAVLTAADVTAPGAVPHVLTVRYTDDVAVRVADLDGHNLRVSGPGYQVLATFVSVDVDSDGSPRTATYRVPAPDGAWQARHNGFYAVNLLPFQVADTSGNFAPAARLGGFHVAIDAPIDTSPPRAMLHADDLTTPGSLYYAFQVDYADDQAIDLTSIGDGDLQVTGPGGFDEPARRVHLATDGARVSVRYRVRPPGGGWDAAWNGSYQVRMLPDRVRDTAHNFAPGRLLGSFRVSPDPAPAHPQAALTATPIATAGAGTHCLYVTYSADRPPLRALRTAGHVHRPHRNRNPGRRNRAHAGRPCPLRPVGPAVRVPRRTPAAAARQPPDRRLAPDPARHGRRRADARYRRPAELLGPAGRPALAESPQPHRCEPGRQHQPAGRPDPDQPAERRRLPPAAATARRRGGRSPVPGRQRRRTLHAQRHFTRDQRPEPILTTGSPTPIPVTLSPPTLSPLHSVPYTQSSTLSPLHSVLYT